MSVDGICTRGNRKWRCREPSAPAHAYCVRHLALEQKRRTATRERLMSDEEALVAHRKREAERARRRRNENPVSAERGRASCRRYYRRNRARETKRGRDQKLWLNYGITREDYNLMLAAQNECCAICHTTEPRGQGVFHVDHDHATGHLRGLLCHHCNVMLGHGKDDPVLLRAAAEYLERGGRFR